MHKHNYKEEKALPALGYYKKRKVGVFPSSRGRRFRGKWRGNTGSCLSNMRFGQKSSSTEEWRFDYWVQTSCFLLCTHSHTNNVPLLHCFKASSFGQQLKKERKKKNTLSPPHCVPHLPSFAPHAPLCQSPNTHSTQLPVTQPPQKSLHHTVLSVWWI